MIGRLLCFFCFHNWLYNCISHRIGEVRQCRRCLRTEESRYDMANGGTYWGANPWLSYIER